jgi:hypothetical protein
MNGDILAFARRVAAIVAAITLAILAGAPAASLAASRAKGAMLEVVSSRPDMVSGGDVLVKVTVPHGGASDSFQVSAAGRDITGAFKPKGEGEYLGLVTGLPLGPSKLELTAMGKTVSLTVNNHPLTGPMFGPAATAICLRHRGRRTGRAARQGL